MAAPPRSSSPRTPDGVVIRIAAGADAPAVRDLLHAAWTAVYGRVVGQDQVDALARDALSDERLAAQFASADGVCLVACVDRRVAGVLFAHVSAEGLRVSRLYVEAAHHGRGLGGALLEALQARAPGAVMSLHVEASNEAARGFYAAKGFREIGRTHEEISGVAFDVRVMRRP